MPFLLKTPTISNARVGDIIGATESAFFNGAAIRPGDEVFVWFSGDAKHLGWLGEAVRVSKPTGAKVSLEVRLLFQACETALTIRDIAPFRDVRDKSGIAGLASKLYRHAHDKVAELSENEVSLLRSYFLRSSHTIDGVHSIPNDRALTGTEWDRLSRISDEDIARAVAGDPDSAPILDAESLRREYRAHAARLP